MTDALELSMFFRETVVGSALKLPGNMHIRPEVEGELVRRINLLINNLQLSIVEVYDANDSDSLPGT